MGTPPVTLRLLGPVEVDVDGEPMGLRARLPRNLLVALALQPGRVIGTDALLTALWDDDPPGSALGTLQSYVSTLRRALGDREREQPLLDRRGDGYVLVVPPEAVDTVRFERLVADARGAAPERRVDLLTDALALWRGPALAEVANEPFARAAAARLDELRLAAEAARIDAGLDLGRHQELVPEIEALVAAHPLREALTAQLVVALYRSGRQADALRALERTREALVDELGISPSTELVQLEGAILRQEVPPWTAPPAEHPQTAPDGRPAPLEPTPPPGETAALGAMGPGPAPGPARVEEMPLPPAATAARRAAAPLVGRDGELRRLLGAWEDRERGRRVLAVSGDAGIGKTRLVAELARAVHARGGVVLWGACPPDGDAHYRPFVEALRPLAAFTRAAGGHPGGGPGAAALARLLPEVVPEGTAPPTSSTGDDRGPLFDALTDLLARATTGTPTLIVVDDLQWADASTCALLAHLARASELAHVRLAVTYRAAETTLPHPSARTLADLRRLRLVEQLPLAGLDDTATTELIEALAGARAGDVDPDLHERTEGNPFFVEELVAHELGGGADLPIAVVDVVEQRLTALDPEHRRVLAAAAVLGRSFSTDVLAAVLGTGTAELLDPVDAAVEAHLVVEDAPPVGHFAFAHALIRDGLLEGMTALRRSHLHLAAADALDALGPPDDLLAARAHHLVAAGAAADAPRTVRALHAAAERALAVAAYDEAETACRQALDLVDLAAATPETTDVLLSLAAVRAALGDAVGARRVYRWAADAARAHDDGVRLGLAATGLGAGSGVGVPMHLGLVDRERIEWLETALDLLDDDEPELRVRFLSHLAVALYDADLTRSVEVSRQALEQAAEVDDATYLSAALIGRRMALWCPDADLAERVDVGARSVVAADAGGDLLYRIVARLSHLADVMEAADLPRYEARLAEAEDLIGPLHQRRWDWFRDMSAVSLLTLHGRYDEADEVLSTAVDRVGDAQGTMPVHIEISSRIVIERDRGGIDASIRRLRAVEAISPRPIFDAALGLCLAVDGERGEAAALLRSHAAQGFTDVPRDHLWAMTMAWYAETAHLVGDGDAAGQAAAALAGREERMLCMGGMVAAGVVGRVRGTALATAGDLDEAVVVLDAALAAHRRMGLRPWVARTALDLARVLVLRGAAGDDERAAGLTAEGEGLARALGMVAPVGPAAPSATDRGARR